MGSLDYALTRKALSEGIVRNVVDDTPIAYRLWYVGTGTVTSVTIDNTAEELVLITSDGGTDTYTVAAYATIGAMVDAVNKDNIFHARVIDALRSDSSDDTLINGAIISGTDENGKTRWDALVDTSVTDYMTVTLSPKGVNYETPGKGHRVSLQEIVYNVDVSGAAANGVRLYNRRGTTETQIWRRASVDATATTINFASGEGQITGKADDELIVRIIDTTSITDAAANFLQVTGRYE